MKLIHFLPYSRPFMIIVCILTFAAPGIVLAEPFEDVTDTVIPGFGGGKAAWGDFDGDGWVDVYAGELWRNEDGAKFTPVEGPFGGEGVWGDYDLDGDLDLYLFSNGRLLKNDGGDGFTDVTEILEARPMKVCRSAAWGDFDGDGFLDLYITGYEIWSPGQEWHDVIFKNNAGKSFTKAWETPAIRRARAVTCADFDEDGDLDIYVSNYRLQPNWLWRNDGDFNFSDVAAPLGNVDGDGGLGAWGHTIGSAWCDFDNDGHIDLFVGNFSHPPAYQDRCKIYRSVKTEDGFTFQEQAGEIIPWKESYATPTFGDYDNDGFLDLYHTSVYGGDASVLYRNTSADDADNDPSTVGSPIGKWTLSDVSEDTHTQSGNTYQAAWADFDNDGDLDLSVAGRLLRNPGNENHWLKVRLKGDRINAYAIGAQVRVDVDNSRMTRQVESSTGEGNQNDLTQHFGLGDRTDPVQIEIRWPDGTQQTITSEVDKTVEVIQQSSEKE